MPNQRWPFPRYLDFLAAVRAIDYLRSQRESEEVPYGTPVHNNTILLQSTLSSASSGASGDRTVLPHHPITCTSKLYFEEDNTFRCEHAEVSADDPRTVAVVIHSMVLLLLEPAVTVPSDWKYKTPDQLRREWFEKYGEEWD